jgi:hypothetical protein
MGWMFWGSLVQFLACARCPYFLQSIQNKSGTYAASYSMEKWVHSPGVRQAKMGLGDQYHTRVILHLGKRPSVHCTRGWVGLWDGLDGCGQSRPLQGFEPRTIVPCRESLYWLSCPSCHHYRMPATIPNGLRIAACSVVTALLLRCQVSWRCCVIGCVVPGDVKDPSAFILLGTPHLVTQHHIPEDPNLQIIYYFWVICCFELGHQSVVVKNNIKILILFFKTTHLCISWWINKTVIISRCSSMVQMWKKTDTSVNINLLAPEFYI